jgi:bifunctional N-acetylglucosamine-1-phosphate-uridyltransferase/glucosamine-1-phosphate-acetyltransferase GlmU-like protein
MAVEPIARPVTPALPPLFAELPAVFAGRFDPEAPWALLGEPLTEILDALPSDAIEIRPLPDVHLAGDRIAIGRGTRIHPTAVIEGPVWIGRNVEIRPGAYIRGGAWIGDGAIVGANTEIKCAILLPGAHAPHLNYVGDSILGRGVNLGAGTILSNFRHDGREIQIPTLDGPTLATGRRKLGAILGDSVLTGCNSVLHPGCVVGRGTQIYPGVQLRPGIYPEASVVKLRQEIEIAPLLPRGGESPRW